MKKSHFRFPLCGVLCVLGAGLTMASGCGDEGVTAPTHYNSGRYRRVEILPNENVQGAGSTVKPLNGMHGSPVSVVPGDESLRLKYWGRIAGSPEKDGAHVSMVRLGTDVDCAISLESVFPDQKADLDDPNNYEFEALDAHVASVVGTYDPTTNSFSNGLNTARLLWQAGLNIGPSNGCQSDAWGHQQGSAFSTVGDYPLWADVAFNTLQHLRGVGKWSATGAPNKVSYVEFMDDPIGRFPGGYTDNWLAPNWTRLFDTYELFAKKIKEAWPDQPDEAGKALPRVHVGGISFSFSDVSALQNASNKHGLIRFIDYCKAKDAPLDFISFKTKTAHAYQALQIATAIRTYLDQSGYGHVELIATSVVPDYGAPSLTDIPALAFEDIRSAHLGAFQTAARIYFQDVPVQWMIGGRGPRVFSDLNTYESLGSFASLVVESDFFSNTQGTAIAKPAYLAMFPFRQVKGHQRVRVADGSDTESMTILASRDPNNDKVLHVVVANANVGGGMASINYDLLLQQFAPPQVVEIDYKLAILDRNSHGVGSFHFSETGTLQTGLHSGSLRFVHEMAVPSVHYIQFIKP